MRGGHNQMKPHPAVRRLTVRIDMIVLLYLIVKYWCVISVISGWRKTLENSLALLT
jgi:hypothetical protein